MNWHKRLTIKTAAAKSKIQKFGIADPSVKFFIHKYENILPWDKIDQAKQKGQNPEEFIQSFISSSLLPSIQKKIDPNSDDNNYIKKYDVQGQYEAAMAGYQANPEQPVPPELEMAYQIYLRDPVGAEEKLKGVVNKDKYDRFHEWWNYLDEEDSYKESPAFKYAVLKPIIDSSPEKTEVAPLPLNPEALTRIWDDITTKGVNQMNVLKQYRKESGKINEARANTIDVEGEKNNKWMNIPSKIKDQHNYKINKAMLQGFSQGTSWCIAGEQMSDTYLSKGDFWLYLEDSRAVVAIRLDSKDKVLEIRGHQYPDSNGWSKLQPYWQEVTNFLHKSKLDYKENDQYKKLEKIWFMNKDLERGNPDYNEVTNRIQQEHSAYLMLSDENRQKFPEFLEIAVVGYRKELDNYLREMEVPGMTETQYFSTFEKFQGYYNKILPEIKTSLGDMQPRIIQAHKKVFTNNPYLFPEFPKEIQQQFSPQERKEAWEGYIAEDPYRFNDDRIGDIKGTLQLDLKSMWINLIRKNALHLDYMPKVILNSFEPNELAPILLEDFSRHPVSQRYSGIYDKLGRVEKFVEQGIISREHIVDIFRNSLTSHPEWIDAIPPQYKEEVMGGQNAVDMTGVIRDKAIRSIQTPDYFKGLSLDIQNAILEQYGQDIGSAFVKNSGVYGGMIHQFWMSVPENVRPFLPNNIREKAATLFAQQLAQDMTQFDKAFSQIPPDIQGDVWNKLAFGKNWYKKAKTEREYKDHLQKILGVGKYKTDPQHSMDMHDGGDDGW